MSEFALPNIAGREPRSRHRPLYSTATVQESFRVRVNARLQGPCFGSCFDTNLILPARSCAEGPYWWPDSACFGHFGHILRLGFDRTAVLTQRPNKVEQTPQLDSFRRSDTKSSRLAIFTPYPTQPSGYIFIMVYFGFIMERPLNNVSTYTGHSIYGVTFCEQNVPFGINIKVLKA
jgi:hypothetical protein